MFDVESVESAQSAHVSTGEYADAEIEGVSWKQAHRELQRIAKQRATLDVEEARWIVVAKKMQVHVELGFATFLEYLERTLGYRRRVAFERVRVADALEQLPRTREMLADGDVSYSAVREITRVAKRGPSTRGSTPSPGRRSTRSNGSSADTRPAICRRIRTTRSSSRADGRSMSIRTSTR